MRACLLHNSPKTCRLTETIQDAPVLIFTSEAFQHKLATWQDRGAEVIGLPGQVRSEVIVHFFRLERIVPQIAPEHRLTRTQCSYVFVHNLNLDNSNESLNT